MSKLYQVYRVSSDDADHTRYLSCAVVRGTFSEIKNRIYRQLKLSFKEHYDEKKQEVETSQHYRDQDPIDVANTAFDKEIKYFKEVNANINYYKSSHLLQRWSLSIHYPYIRHFHDRILEIAHNPHQNKKVKEWQKQKEYSIRDLKIAMAQKKSPFKDLACRKWESNLYEDKHYIIRTPFDHRDTGGKHGCSMEIVTSNKDRHKKHETCVQDFEEFKLLYRTWMKNLHEDYENDTLSCNYRKEPGYRFDECWEPVFYDEVEQCLLYIRAVNIGYANDDEYCFDCIRSDDM